jgi:hypothetical protein
VRIADRYDVPWTAYTVTFSGDGERLAIGGGTFYGAGGIAIVELASHALHAIPLATLEPDGGTFGGTASGLQWTRDDRHLFASTWGSRYNPAPALALRVRDGALEVAGKLPIRGSAAPTGIVTTGNTAYLRMRGSHRDVLATGSWKDLELDPEPPVQHLTGNRLVLARERVVTGDHLISLDRGDPLRAGLLVRQLGDSVTTHVVASDLAHITAIGVTADGNLITGTEIGELDLWTWGPHGPVVSRRLGVIPLPIVVPDASWITYRPSSVVAICCLADGSIAAVTAGGMLAISRTNERLVVWPIPAPGSPRSIAAHPDRAVVAVGFKRGGFVAPESPVAMIEIEPQTIDPAWRTERVLAIAAQARMLEAATLGVLADALEEIGAAPRVLAHLRTHDPRCTRCWVVELLQ